MTQKQKKLLTLALLALALVLFVLGMLVLPETLVMQISTGGAAATTLPKPLGLLISTALVAVFAVLWYRGDNSKHLLVSAVGVVTFAMTFFMNL